MKYYGILFIAAVVIVLSGKYKTYLDKQVEKCVGDHCPNRNIPSTFVIKDHGKLLNEILTNPIVEEVKKEVEVEKLSKAERRARRKAQREANQMIEPVEQINVAPEEKNNVDPEVPVNQTEKVEKVKDYGVIWEDMNDYQRGDFLGNGTFGFVYRAYKDNQTYVLKHFKRPFNTSNASSRRKELRMYKAAQGGPNIAQFIAAVRDPKNTTDTAYIIESVNMTNPTTFVHELTKEDTAYYFYHMMLGMEYLHSKKIIHGDLKLYNIAVDTNKRMVRILDLGTAKYVDLEKQKEFHKGTPVYRAPELILGSTEYGTEVDMWAMGCIFGKMLFNRTSHYKYKKDNLYHLLNQQAKEVGTFRINRLLEKYNLTYPFNETLPHYPPVDFKTYINENNQDRVTDDAIDLLSRMLTADPKRRITATEALQHRYFKKMRKLHRRQGWNDLLYTPMESFPEILRHGYHKAEGVN